jgi:hypothetical protein
MRPVMLVLVTLIVPIQAFADFKPSQICTPEVIRPGSRGQVDQRQLVGQLLKAQGLSEIDLDTRAHEVTYPMKRDAILAPSAFCETHKFCAKDAVQKLGRAYTELFIFIRTNSKPVEPGKTGFEILRASNGRTVTPEELLADTWSDISAVCVVAPEKSTVPTQPDGKVEKPSVTQRFMVRKKVDDLRYSQDEKTKFKALDRASLSVTSDYIKHTTTYAIDGVAGYGIGKIPLGQYAEAEIVGFGSYTRQFVAGAAPKNAPNVHNIGFGGLGNVIFDAFGGSHSLQFYSQFVHSDVTDANIVSGNMVYTPLTGVLIGRPIYLFGTIAVLLTPQAKFVFGRVLEAGTSTELVSKDDFTRAGGRIELLLVDDGGFFNGFSLRTSYEYLKVITGTFDSIDRFESTLSYKFPEQQFWSIDLRFMYGRNLDTLEQQRQLTLGVGFKY